MSNLIDLSGKKFGRLTVIERIGTTSYSSPLWKCACDCGTICSKSSKCLMRGETKSCGCLHKERIMLNIKHGDSHYGKYHRLYRIWTDMKNRCNSSTCKRYNDYGGRGIKVCDEWDEYINFKKWALNNGYGDKLTIDRIDVNGDYRPDNCKWSTYSEQNSNTRRTRRIQYNGEIHTVTDWSKILGIPRTTIIDRLNKNWSVDKALSK